MKGISEVIATILMLMITLALSGTAYLFISGTFVQQTQGLELIDAYCMQGTIDNVSITVRNIGTAVVNTADIRVTQTAPVTTTDLRWDSLTISAGNTATVYDECESTGPRVCMYRISPLAGRTLSVPVSCS